MVQPGSRRVHEVFLIVPEQALLLEASGIADIFARANRSLEESSRLPRYLCRVVSTTRRRSIEGASGLRLEANDLLSELDPATPRDTVIVTGKGAGPLHVPNPAIADWLRLAAKRIGRIASVCTGAFHLAEAGLLKGRRATTHWKALEEFALRYPDSLVESDPIFVRDGKVHTSAGASAGLDLALSFVERDLGEEIARDVARHMVLYLRRPGGQSQFSVALERQAKSNGPIREIQNWILDHLHEDLRVERLAERAAMSPRHFARVFLQEAGSTPARYVEELRLECARQRLEQTRDTVESVASDCGLDSALNLRRVFQRHLGVTPGEYRERFGRI